MKGLEPSTSWSQTRGATYCATSRYLGGFRSLLASEAPPDYTRQTICWSITLVKILSLFTSTSTSLSSLKQHSSRLFHDWPVDSDYTKQGLKGSGLELAYYSPFFSFYSLCFRLETKQLLNPLSNSFQIKQAI